MQSVQYCKNEIMGLILEDLAKVKESKVLHGGENDWNWYKKIELVKSIDSKLYDLLDNFPLGNLGNHFIKCVNENYFNDIKDRSDLRVFKLWRICAEVDRFLNDLYANKTEIINNLSRTLNILTLFTQTHGTAIDSGLIRQIYLTENSELIQLFRKYFPTTPPISLFDGNRIPALFVQLENDQKKALNNLYLQNENDPLLEQKIKLIQRYIRRRLRKGNEIKRIVDLYFSDSTEMNPNAMAAKAIEDANTPYKPIQCSPHLSKRIVNAAKRIKLFSTVKHLASAKHLSSIIDTCMFGRKNLIEMYVDFRPSALGEADIQDGDFNVICFGSDLIDMNYLKGKTIGLIFDSEMLLNKRSYNYNPAIFFKQQDFGFELSDIQEVKILNLSLLFNHTRSIYHEDLIEFASDDKTINLQVYKNGSGKRELEYFSDLPKYSFISYNTASISQILILNFFRFLDTLKDIKRNPAHDKIAAIYNKIAELNDEQLLDFLTDLGKKMSHTCEFNFSGAYKIDLEALREIEIYRDREKIASLELDVLIESVNRGSEEVFKNWAKDVPELFQSKRFIEYLSSQFNNKSLLDQFI